MNLLPNNIHPVSRGSTAIYLILKANIKEHASVLFPANICYAAIFPAVYNNNIVRFCDVDPRSGNVTLESIKTTCQRTPIDAAVLPHMYGNPITGMTEIIDFLHDKGVLVIEDCASAMGATYEDGAFVGEKGDYSVFSTGYSKTIDIGFGGLLASKYFDLDKCLQYEQSLPTYSHAFSNCESLFSIIYRKLRNDSYPDGFASELFLSLINPYRDIFLSKLNYEERNIILESLNSLKDIIQERNNCQLAYLNCFQDLGIDLKLYDFPNGSVPWRFSFFVDSNIKSAFVEYLLNRNVLISDWYPSVVSFFGLNDQDYPNAYAMGESILNLPFTNNDESITRYCHIIKDACDVFCV